MCSRQHKDKSEKLFCDATFYHYYSHDKNNQHVLSLSIPLEDPVHECSCFDFCNFTGFWPSQFDEIVREMPLSPRIIVYRLIRSTSALEIALFVLLHRWKKRMPRKMSEERQKKGGGAVHTHLHHALFLN